MKRDIPRIGQIYRHFKGFIATIHDIAIHTETREVLVVYECSENTKGVYTSDHKAGIYARPLDMFLSKVDHEKYPECEQKYRFELVKEE